MYIPGTTNVCTFFLLFAHSSCTSLFILLFIKSTVYCIAHFTPYFYFILTYIYIYSLVLCFIFIFIFLHCPLSGPVLIYISLLIISCIIEYMMNKRTLTLTLTLIENDTLPVLNFWQESRHLPSSVKERINVQSWQNILAPLVNMIKESCEN